MSGWSAFAASPGAQVIVSAEGDMKVTFVRLFRCGRFPGIKERPHETEWHLRTIPNPTLQAACLAVLLVPLAGCSIAGGDRCENKLIEAKADLQGSLVAYRYTRDCGATAEASMNVAVGERGGGLEGATRVFTADSNHGAAETDGPAIWVEMHWTQPHRLSVAYAEKALVFASAATAAGAAIVYRATSRNVMPPVPIMPDVGAGKL